MIHQNINNKFPLEYNYAKNVDSSDVPSNIHYFLILPFNVAQARLQKSHKTTPKILTYIDDNISFQDLLDEYKKMNSVFKDKKVLFTTESRQILKNNQSVKSYKYNADKQNIDGMILCIQDIEAMDSQKHYNNQPNQLFGWKDEACLDDYNKNQTKQTTICLSCQIPTIATEKINRYGKTQFIYSQKIIFIYLNVSRQSTGESVKTGLVNYLKEYYAVDLKKEQIESIRANNSQDVVDYKGLVEQYIFDDSRLTINLKNKMINLKRVKNKNRHVGIMIYQEDETDPILFTYGQIQHLTFEQFYRPFLISSESKDKIQAVYCLKILDFIIKPKESLGKIDHYINYLKETTPAILVGKVVSQKMLFYQMMSEIAKQTSFSISELSIPKIDISKRQECRNLAKLRAQKASHQHLKVFENLQPILIYTSGLRYLNSENDQQQVIYSALNTFLRNSTILSLDSKQYKDWKYRYASMLLKHLNKIQRFNGKVYRGIRYDPKIAINSIVTFKQFTSTSMLLEKAMTFSGVDISQPPFIIYEIQTVSGISIKQYSYYAREQEILLQPFTECKVTNIETKILNNNNWKIYYLKQIITSKTLPAISANFVVWVDDKLRQGKRVFQSMAYLETTLFIQLTSTSQLKHWLETNKNLFTDKTANIVFITNMKRQQGYIRDDQAGIKAIQQLKKYSQTTPICVYIGNLQEANNKISRHKINPNNMVATNSRNDVIGFLVENLFTKKQSI